MQKVKLNRRFVYIVLAGVFVLFFAFLALFNFQKDNPSALAAPICGDNNIAGFAWSDTIGWVSFNSGDCDGNSNGFIDLNCGGDDSTTPVIPYGVKIDWPTGNFSGYAWSSNIGWVSFNEINPPDNYLFNTNCPSACNSSNNCTACYNSTSNNVYGWAKALSLGDDGWIKLSDASWSNGVKINGISKEFEGWAWNGNTTAGTGIGWISFSHLDCDPDGDGFSNGVGSCPPSGTPIADYKVYITNTTPTATYLSAPNINYTNACDWRDARRVQLTWQFSDQDVVACGDYQSAYQVVVDQVNHVPTELDAMAINTTRSLPLKTSKLSGSALSLYPTNPGNNPDYTGVDLNYDEHYYWWVKVWDKYNADSGWVQFATTTPDTDNDDTGQAGCNPNCDKTFWTYKHEFPEAYFYWFPLVPSKDEKTIFTDFNSLYYIYTGPTTNIPSDCFNVATGLSDCTYQWSSLDTGVTIDPLTQTASSTNIVFGEAKTDKTISLQVTDPETYSCSTSTTFKANIKLPTWKEVKYK